jgi:hypothetical protein
MVLIPQNSKLEKAGKSVLLIFSNFRAGGVAQVMSACPVLPKKKKHIF